MIATPPPRVIAYLYARYSPRPTRRDGAAYVPGEEREINPDGAVVTSEANACKSIEHQMMSLREECARLGWQIGGEFADRKVSGDDADRPGLLAAFEAIGPRKGRKKQEHQTELGALNALIYKPRGWVRPVVSRVLMVLDLSRLARHGIHQEIYLNMIWAAGASVYSMMEKRLHQPDDSPADSMQREILAVFNRFQKRVTAAKTSMAKRQQQASGVRITSRDKVPYGMRAAPGKRLEPHPDEQAAIALMVEMSNAGASYYKIVAELKARGFKPRGEEWHRSTVMRTLQRVRAATPCTPQS